MKATSFRITEWRDIRLWVLLLLLVATFVVDLLLPQVVLLPFMYVPVVAAAAIAGPTVTGLFGALALVLGIVAGFEDNYIASDDYWFRLAGLLLSGAVAVFLAYLRSHREQQLAASEAQLRLMLDNTADVVVRYNAKGDLLWASPSLTRTFGWRPEDVVNTSFRLVAPNFKMAEDVALNDAIANGQDGFQLRLQVTCADGTLRWGDSRSTLVRSTDGVVESVVASIRDVTEQVEVEAALAQRERRYRLLADNSTDSVFLLDPDGLIRWCSPSVQTEFGYERDALQGRPRIDYVHFEDRKVVGAEWAKVSPATVVRYEERFLLASGEYRWMSVAVRPLLGEAGEELGRVATLRDVDAEVTLRDALHRSERTFHLAMDGAAQGMAVVGLHHRFLEVNDALCRMVGHDPEWMLEHNEMDVFTPDEAAAILNVGDRLLSGKVDNDIHTSKLLTSTGDTVLIEHAVSLLRDEHGMPLFFVCQYPSVVSA